MDDHGNRACERERKQRALASQPRSWVWMPPWHSATSHRQALLNGADPYQTVGHEASRRWPNRHRTLSGSYGPCGGSGLRTRWCGVQQRRRLPGGVGTAEEAPGQWLQERAWPASSAVRKLDPQPQAATAFGLLTVKPAPMSVST